MFSDWLDWEWIYVPEKAPERPYKPHRPVQVRSHAPAGVRPASRPP